MSELHPEALIERVAYGRADARERGEIAEHLQECEACRLELAVRRAARDELATADDDEARLARAIETAVDRSADIAARPRSRTLEGLLIGAGLGAAILLLASLTVRLLDGRVARDADEANREQAILQPELGEASGVATTPAPRPAPKAARPSAPTIEPAPEVVEEEAVATPDRRERDRTKPATTRTPAEIFADATKARRDGRTQHALDLFERIIDDHPDTREARTSRILAGRLWLDAFDEPRRALPLFESYLRESSGGSLRPEALAGKARCLTRIGDDAAARQAWQSLLDTYPQSAPASAARAALQGAADP